MLPIVGTLVGDELKDAIARAVLARRGVTGPQADVVLAAANVVIEWKNVRLADGSQHLFATVGLFPRAQAPTDTPAPETSAP
jgi:hypothetical protein